MNLDNVIRLAPGKGLRDRAAIMSALKGSRRLLMIVSAPGLKILNRIQGIEAGDALLVELGRTIINAAPAGATVGRLAGAKLSVACSASKRDQALSILGELSDSISLYTNTSIPVHIGAVWSEDAIELGEMIEAAMMALDDARSNGAQGSELAEVGTVHKDDMRIAREALDAIRAGAASVAMQPVVDAQTPGRVMFHDALIRLTRPNGDLVCAGEFMPALEKLGVTSEADIAVLNMAASDLADDPSLRASVNVAATSLARPGWRTAFLNFADRAPEAAERLIVEVSEDAALSDISAATELFMQLRVRGVSLALDDFDTGRTSCQHLRDFRFDMLKIDGGFISGIDQSPDNQILVSALTGIGRQFDMMVIAEYVETAQEARVLRNLVVDGFQGYLFGKPTLIWDKGQSSNRVNA